MGEYVDTMDQGFNGIDSDEESAIDHYINWAVAREQLIDLHKATIAALRVCDVAMQSGEYKAPSDELVARLFELVSLDNEQIRRVSLEYINSIEAVLAHSLTLKSSEINVNPE